MFNPRVLHTVKSQLRRHESFRSAAYKDSRGFLTIGYGRLIDSEKQGGITRAEAEVLMANDVRAKAEELLASAPIVKKLSNIRQAVLLNMAFNLGVKGLLGFKKMWAAIAVDNFTEAAAQILDSAYAKQVGSRADELSSMFAKGKA